jgi:predicted lipid-binding transport protein (Tim44 family)
MGGSGSFPIDLLLFGMIAAFLVLRLRSILGRKTGFERPAQPETPAAGVPGLGRPATVVPLRPAPAAPVRALPDPASPTGQVLARMHEVNRAFDPAHFLAGAEAAFRMIVTAFAAGDRVALRPLLSDDTYRAFEGAIATRETAGETQRSEVRSIQTAAIEAAGLSGSHATITVRLVSDQVAETLDRAGRSVQGTDAVTELTDLWTFERDLAQPDPAWRLSAAQSG